MKIYLISGKAGSGKDTVGNYLYEQSIVNKKRPLIIHFADLVKFYAKQYWDWNGEKTKVGRRILQIVGTEIMRKHYPTYWANIVGEFICALTKENLFDVVIIPDWRFINEYETVFDLAATVDAKVVTIRVNRFSNDQPYINPNLSEEQRSHISECELDNFIFDWVIENRTTEQELLESVNFILSSEGVS